MWALAPTISNAPSPNSSHTPRRAGVHSRRPRLPETLSYWRRGGLSRGGAFARSAHLDSVLSPLSCRNKKGGPTEGDTAIKYPKRQESTLTAGAAISPTGFNAPFSPLSQRTRPQKHAVLSLLGLHNIRRRAEHLSRVSLPYFSIFLYDPICTKNRTPSQCPVSIYLQASFRRDGQRHPSPLLPWREAVQRSHTSAFEAPPPSGL